jgi:hypothetical protein
LKISICRLKTRLNFCIVIGIALLFGTVILAQTLRDVLTQTPTGQTWAGTSNTFARVWCGTTGGALMLTNTSVYLAPNNSSATLLTTDAAGATRVPVTRATTLQNLFAVCNPTPGLTRTNTITVMTNGAASPLLLSFTGTNATALSNITDVVTIQAWDQIGVRITSSGTLIGSKISWAFEGR